MTLSEINELKDKKLKLFNNKIALLKDYHEKKLLDSIDKDFVKNIIIEKFTNPSFKIEKDCIYLQYDLDEKEKELCNIIGSDFCTEAIFNRLTKKIDSEFPIKTHLTIHNNIGYDGSELGYYMIEVWIDNNLLMDIKNYYKKIINYIKGDNKND